MTTMTSSKHILFIDAYDSFSQTIVALLKRLLDVDVTLIRSDSWFCEGEVRDETALSCSMQIGTEIAEAPESACRKRSFNLRDGQFPLLLDRFDAVVVGPGPGDPRNPEDLGIIASLWQAAEQCGIPVLGVCLGFQSLCLAYGATIACLPEPCHGQAQEIFHSGQDIFFDVGPVIATNYHSLEVKLQTWQIDGTTTRPVSVNSSSSHGSDELSGLSSYGIKPLAWNVNGTLMAVRHSRLPFWGLQFHPESCRSNTACQDIVRGWWTAAMAWSSGARQVIPSPIVNVSYRTAKRLDKLQDRPCSDLPRASTALLAEMQRLTRSTCPIVQSQTLKFSGGFRHASDLCYKLSSNQATVMLESQKKGRYCIYAMPGPDTFRLEYFKAKNGHAESCTRPTNHNCTIYSETYAEGMEKFVTCNVLDDLHQLILCKRAKQGLRLSPFWGGFLGYLSYELGLDILDVSVNERYSRSTKPDVSLLWTERSIVVDKLTREIYIQSTRKDDSAWISDMATTLSSKTCKHVKDHVQCSLELEAILASSRISLPDETTYKKNIETCQAHLRAGSSYELCLTTEAQIILHSYSSTTPWTLYKNIQRRNAAPFSAYVTLGRSTILSSSPEQFLTWDRNGIIDMIPMKGTVSKADPGMTLAKAVDILASPKESAENLMIADLIRHDLYSTVGSDSGASVEVVKLCEVIEHETVFQLVSHIRGRAPVAGSTLAPRTTITSNHDSVERASTTAVAEDEKQQKVMYYGHRALQKCIPPGSMTGAPKKRSCEILHRLEKRSRGVYSGVLGYLDVGGGGSFNVCIRTAFSDQDDDKDGNQTWRVGAGGAITVLSNVDAEWEEMQTKLESVLRAFRPGEA